MLMISKLPQNLQEAIISTGYTELFYSNKNVDNLH